MLTELYAAYDGDVDFLGINIRDTSAANARSFELDRGVDYPSIYAPDGDALLAFTGRTSPRSTPSTLVLDEDGGGLDFDLDTTTPVSFVGFANQATRERLEPHLAATLDRAR